MAKRNDIHKVLIIGSGPIIIGQACEFDYSGTQACKALRNLGYEIVLVNSNPATIMTDPEIADVTYIEPLNVDRIEQIIKKERPDALLPNLGGQSGLNLCSELAQAGVLEKYNVEVIGVQVDAIERGEDRIEFKHTMDQLGIEMARSEVAYSVDEALAIAEKLGYPVVLRPAYTMGGAGGGLVYNVDELKTLLEVALVQSTGASNRIEGIFTSDKRLEELVSQKAEPRNRSEQEIAGYREVLSTIYEGYEYINPRPNIILQLHRDLYSYSQGSAGGSYKNSDNVIAETDAEGHQKARFIPVPAFQTAEAMDELCRQFLEAWNTDKIDRLLLIPMFILDFLCIHPFNDGNGRMSRLLSLLLYYKAGYIVGKYVSMEMLIEKTKETYYEALQASSTGWHENENSYEPFLKYYLGITLKAYNEFESRVEHLKNRTLSKPERIKAMIDQKVGKITKKEIMDAHPDISKTTVERTLADLVKSEYIAKVGSGPATGYVKI